MHLVLVDNYYPGSLPSIWGKLKAGPPLGLLTLASIARGHGWAVSVYDLSVSVLTGRLRQDADLFSSAASEILALNPTVVGLTAVGQSFLCAVNISRHLRRMAPDLPIIMGGPHPTACHRHIIETVPTLDAVVRNEAELVLPALLDALPYRQRLADVPGLTFADAGAVVVNPDAPRLDDLDDLPEPAWDAWPHRELGLTRMVVEAGRGCPHRCAFCTTSHFFGRKYRLKSPGRLVADLDHLHEICGVSSFSLQHDFLTADKRAIYSICDALRGRSYRWSCSSRHDAVDPELLGAMRDAGCEGIFFGVESLDPQTLDAMHKHMDLDLLDERVAASVELDIHTSISFIHGFPREQRQHEAAILRRFGALLLRHPHDRVHVLVNALSVEPGSELLGEVHPETMRWDGFMDGRPAVLLEEGDEARVRSDTLLYSVYHYLAPGQGRRHHLAVQSVIQTLRVMDNLVLAALLRVLGLPLDVLVYRIVDAWAEAVPVPWQVVLEQLRTSLGGPHALVDLLHFGCCMRGAWAAVGQEPRTATDGSPTLAPSALLLFDVVDPQAQLQALAAGELVDGPRAHWLYQVGPGHDDLWRAQLSAAQADVLAGIAGVPAPPGWRPTPPVPATRAFIARLEARGVIRPGAPPSSLFAGVRHARRVL